MFYISEGSAGDRHSQELVAVATSLHSSQQFGSFRQCDAAQHGAALTGVGAGERLFTASRTKALILVYLWGKESVDQKFPVPEQLTCLALCRHPLPPLPPLLPPPLAAALALPAFRLPWLLAAGSKTGKVYIWELLLGALLCVKDAHYQAATVLRFLPCGTFLVTGGADLRVCVWRTLDLILVYARDPALVRPHASWSHALAVTALEVLGGILPDLRVWSASRDCTMRVYDVQTRQLLTTFVADAAIESVARDPAGRACYLGMASGVVRAVPMYEVNEHTAVLQSVGGGQRVVTLVADPELKASFVQHLAAVTHLAVSLDGTILVSGDLAGRVFASDVVTRQVVQTFRECNSAVLHLCVCVSSDLLAQQAGLVPPLKRVLASTEPLDHAVYMEIGGGNEEDDFEAWLRRKEAEEDEMARGGAASVVTVVGTSEAEAKLARVSQAYTELRAKHEELQRMYRRE